MNSNSIDTKETRKFGLIALIFFGCLFAIGIWVKKPVPIYLFGCLSLLGLAFTLVPGPLRPVHAGWLKIAHFIGRAITALALILAYYLVITPSAFIKRLFGGRPLPVRPDKNVSTYWVERSEPVQPKERFIKRY
ncbi:MAG: hypothetical protein JRJ86_10610 [Deltaproteobacteria bacterium]|nr:hypothetical protein [Deltaproteobacteria bacterium]MBW2118822.1 hypothetical protein [Deltaproteobacteria bacterium]MBW2343898.1 hypothetical protein [Deltaproteobacteria bacterium]